MFRTFISSIAVPALINIICAMVYDAYKKSSNKTVHDAEEDTKYTRKYILTCHIQGVLGLILGIVLLLCGIFSTDEYLSTFLYTGSFFSLFLSFCGTECLVEAANYFLDKSDADSNTEND